MYVLDKAAAITRAIEVIDQQIAAGSVDAEELALQKAWLLQEGMNWIEDVL